MEDLLKYIELIEHYNARILKTYTVLFEEVMYQNKCVV